MEKLNYGVLKASGYTGYILETAPEKVLQFGEGNFLRAFVDWIVQDLNDKNIFSGGVVVVQPVPMGRVLDLAKQVQKSVG